MYPVGKTQDMGQGAPLQASPVTGLCRVAGRTKQEGDSRLQRHLVCAELRCDHSYTSGRGGGGTSWPPHSKQDQHPGSWLH